MYLISGVAYIQIAWIIVLLVTGFLSFNVEAANWLMLQGTEKPGAPALNINGFLMADYQNAGGGKLVAGPFKDNAMAKGRVGPGLSSAEGVDIRKLQVGMRGALRDSWGYSIRGVMGNNLATRGEHDNALMLVEASMTWSAVPGLRVRGGMFKAPGSEESLRFAPPGDYMNLTNVTGMLVQERFFNADGSALHHANNYVGCSCCRDSGIMLFDALTYRSWEFTYAAMLARGYGLGFSDPNPNPDLYLYLASERLTGAGKGIWRQGWKIYGWSQHGQRTLRVGEAQCKRSATRERYGFGTTILLQHWRLSAEFIYASGMIYMATDGGAIPGTVSNSGAMIASYNVSPDDHAHGWYIDGGYEVIPGLWSCLRYDEVRFGTDTVAERELSTLTLGLQYFLTKRLQVKCNYEFRTGKARRQVADTPTNLNMAEMPDRFGAQVVWNF